MNILTKRDTRAQELFNLGLKFNGSEYVKDDFNVHWTEIICDTDQEFDEKINKIKTEMNNRNA